MAPNKIIIVILSGLLIWLWVSVVVANGQMAYMGEGGDGLPRPKTSPTVMDGSDKLSEWFSFHWAAEGFVMPKWSEIFTWDKYLAKVQDGIPRQWDAVYWDNGDKDGKLSCGMCIEEPESKDEPVAVECPLPGDMFVLIQAVDRRKIIGCLRPKQKL